MDDRDPITLERRTNYKAPIIRALPKADLAIPISLGDITEGKQWPPPHCLRRIDRMERQYEVSKGDFSYFISAPEERMIQFNRIGAVLNAYDDLLLYSEPGTDIEDVTIRMALRIALGKAIVDVLRHGRSVVIGHGGTLQAFDIRSTFPLGLNASDGWVASQTNITPDSKDGEPDAIMLLIWDRSEGNLGGEIRKLENNTLGKVIAPIETVANVRLEVIDRSPVEDSWGTPHVDDIIPIAAEMVRRDSSMSAALDNTEQPLIIANVATADINAALTLLDSLRSLSGFAVEERDPDADDLQALADAIPRSGVFPVPDGFGKIEMLENKNDLAASFSNYAQLKAMFTQITGMAPVEAADSGNIESGIAIERRSERFVLKAASLKNLLHQTTQRVLGFDYEWEFFNESTAPDPESPEPRQGLTTGDDEGEGEEDA